MLALGVAAVAAVKKCCMPMWSQRRDPLTTEAYSFASLPVRMWRHLPLFMHFLTRPNSSPGRIAPDDVSSVARGTDGCARGL
jgi:hypothetical protein